MARRYVWQAFWDLFRSGDRVDSAASGGMAFALSANPMLDPSGRDAREAFDETVAVFEDAELLEFLEADTDPVPADPEFRARLREQLWDMVQDGVTALPKDH